MYHKVKLWRFVVTYIKPDGKKKLEYEVCNLCLPSFILLKIYTRQKKKMNEYTFWEHKKKTTKYMMNET